VRAAGLTALVVAALAGCGAGASAPPRPLDSAQAEQFRSARAQAEAACNGGASLPAVGILVLVYRHYPRSTLDGRPLRAHMDELASKLERCGLGSDARLIEDAVRQR
jgi:hypothetical protein